MAEIVAARDRRLGVPSRAREQWTSFGNAYMDDYKAHDAKYRPATHERSTTSQESAWLRSLESVERQSVQRVEQSRYFQGVTRADIVGAARNAVVTGQVILREGWCELIMGLGQTGDSVSVLSVNWSAMFIKDALLYAADHSDLETPAEHEHNLMSRIQIMEIRANDIVDVDDSEGSPGLLTLNGSPGIRTSYDKLQHSPLQPEHINIYVGDSATDFDCLTAVNLGICIRDEPLGSSQRVLADTFSRLGHEMHHISSLSPSKVQSGASNILVWVRGLNEIIQFVNTLR
ncbi:hypothetical protein B0A48_07287 [Cryoendolithus antarcticus]|uniref:Haloacid dehalogenase-like hydrolase n=1 Tax=Cryoendolithus antarcticus TaxID=1507870 RepID=A0A1V8T8A7_9PEZI|nr:hypothetical protein B0A48_07287 [Cryoendolithus antarcticus]